MKRYLVALVALAVVACGKGTPAPSPTLTATEVRAPRLTPTKVSTDAAPTRPYPSPEQKMTSPETRQPEATRHATAYPVPSAPPRAKVESYPQASATADTAPRSDSAQATYPKPNETIPVATLAPTQAATLEPTVAPPTEQPTRTPLPTATKPPTPTRTQEPIDPQELPHAGPEGRTSNIGPYLLMSPEAGQPTHNLLRSGRMRAYMAVNPEHWGGGDALPNMEGYGRNWVKPSEELDYIRAREDGARRYFDRFAGSYDATREAIHAWMSTWAFEYGDKAFTDDWVAFQREWLRLMHDHGYRAGVGGMKAHGFGDGEISWLAPAVAEADYVFLSESGAPTLMGSKGELTFLYRDLYAELMDVLPASSVPPLILDVCVDGEAAQQIGKPGDWWQRGYIQFGTSQESYLDDVRAYDLETLKDPYVKHVFWFATNITKDTHSFDVNTEMLARANTWHFEP